MDSTFLLRLLFHKTNLSCLCPLDRGRLPLIANCDRHTPPSLCVCVFASIYTTREEPCSAGVQNGPPSQLSSSGEISLFICICLFCTTSYSTVGNINIICSRTQMYAFYEIADTPGGGHGRLIETRPQPLSATCARGHSSRWQIQCIKGMCRFRYLLFYIISLPSFSFRGLCSDRFRCTHTYIFLGLFAETITLFSRDCGSCFLS